MQVQLNHKNQLIGIIKIIDNERFKKNIKNCPSGMELDCTLCENVFFDKVIEDAIYPIILYHENNGCRNTLCLTEDGKFNFRPGYKCVIFPKGKTTWEEFHRPFKDGDIVYLDFGHYYKITIFKRQYSDFLYYHASLRDNNVLSINISNSNSNICMSYLKEIRFATEEEKAQLFDAIKANGYKWNAYTMTLEKLVKPIFKKGDKVRVKNGVSEPRIIDGVFDTFYSLVSIGKIDFTDQDNWELVPVEPIFKIGYRIKKKDSNEDVVLITDITDNYYIVETKYGMEVTINISIQDEYELVPNKFDITTLKPFDKVLVRDCNKDKWNIDFFAYYRDSDDYQCMTFVKNQCIPYKNNEHLLGTTNDCDDFYKKLGRNETKMVNYKN